jgi:hypothetical protein
LAEAVNASACILRSAWIRNAEANEETTHGIVRTPLWGFNLLGRRIGEICFLARYGAWGAGLGARAAIGDWFWAAYGAGGGGTFGSGAFSKMGQGGTFGPGAGTICVDCRVGGAFATCYGVNLAGQLGGRVWTRAGEVAAVYGRLVCGWLGVGPGSQVRDPGHPGGHPDWLGGGARVSEARPGGPGWVGGFEPGSQRRDPGHPVWCPDWHPVGWGSGPGSQVRDPGDPGWYSGFSCPK